VEPEIMAAFDVGDVPEPTFLPALDRAPVARSGGLGKWIMAAAVLAAAVAAAAWWMLRD
jgi:hypothetical protein